MLRAMTVVNGVLTILRIRSIAFMVGGIVGVVVAVRRRWSGAAIFLWGFAIFGGACSLFVSLLATA